MSLHPPRVSPLFTHFHVAPASPAALFLKHGPRSHGSAPVATIIPLWSGLEMVWLQGNPLSLLSDYRVSVLAILQCGPIFLFPRQCPDTYNTHTHTHTKTDRTFPQRSVPVDRKPGCQSTVRPRNAECAPGKLSRSNLAIAMCSND